MQDLANFIASARKNRHNGVISLFSSAFIGFAIISSLPNLALANEDLLDLDAEVKLELEPIGGISSVCDNHVEARGWNTPEKPFSVAVGTGIVAVAPGHVNYINERQNAYDQAVLNAKGLILEGLRAKVTREVASRIFAGKFPEPATPKGQIASFDSRDMSLAFSKSLELVHRELDKKLEATDPLKPETAEQADRIIEQVGGKTFENVVDTLSREMLIGVSRAFVAETSRKGIKGEICVVVVTSENLRNVARAIVSQDADFLPPAKPGKPLSQHIPNPKTKKGLLELLTSYGVQIVRDENGDYAVISFAQASAKSTSQLMLKAAKEEALARAQGELRSFMGEVALKTKSSQNYSSYGELADGREIYEGGSALDVAIRSESASLDIVGAKPSYWGVKHPVSNQPIAGAILVWTPASMHKSHTEIKNNNQPIKKVGNFAKQTRSSTAASNGTSMLNETSSVGVSGSSGAGTTDDDF